MARPGSFRLRSVRSVRGPESRQLASRSCGTPARRIDLAGAGQKLRGRRCAHPERSSRLLIDDPQIEAVAPFLIHDADASQHSAVIDAMKGHNLVIQGPPGTGKSQTIANIVANGLAADKTILFVAEKQAALEVVKRRLERAGLGEFCLELHSDKASPKVVLESIEERLKVRPIAVPAAPGSFSARKQGGDCPVSRRACTQSRPSGRTPFDLIWQALRGSTLNSGAVESFPGSGCRRNC